MPPPGANLAQKGGGGGGLVGCQQSACGVRTPSLASGELALVGGLICFQIGKNCHGLIIVISFGFDLLFRWCESCTSRCFQACFEVKEVGALFPVTCCSLRSVGPLAARYRGSRPREDGRAPAGQGGPSRDACMQVWRKGSLFAVDSLRKWHGLASGLRPPIERRERRSCQ